jgi:hypothetical protein
VPFPTSFDAGLIASGMLEAKMSNGGAQSASGIAAYRTARELGSRSPRSYAAVREPNELVVIHRFARSTDPRAKSTASFVSPDGSVSLASDAMASLVRDARCLAKNWHPNIARVRHVDIDGEDLTIATELVDGATLADLFAAAAAQRAAGAGSAGAAKAAPGEPLLPLPVLVRILVDVITGLSGLHGLRDDKGAPLGALHGALSPANIVVGKDGVARLLNALRPRPLRVAAGTEAVGYAAPEALDLGATQDVRADLHSVGVIMWEGLTGRRLYDETDPARVLARQREEDVAPPSFPSGSPFARLADVTMRALAFDPALRFKTAAEMGAALRNIAATRIATGSVVAAQVAELAGERIRARRIELDPSTTGKRRLTSDRNLRAAKAPAPATTPAESAAASVDHDTLPPGAMDPTDLGPPSSLPHDLSVRDFLDPSASGSTPSPAPGPPATAPALPKKTLVGQAAPAAKQTLVGQVAPAPALAPALAPAPAPAYAPSVSAGKPAPKPAPPLIRKSPNAVSSASMKVATPVPAPAMPVASQTTDRGLGPPATAAPPPATVAPAPAPLPEPAPEAAPTVVVAAERPSQSTVPLRTESPNQVSPAPAAPVAVPVFDDVAAAPVPRVAYMPVVHATPEAAFTPASIAPPRDRRPAVAILLGCLLALVLLVGFFAVRAMVATPATTATAATATTAGTAAIGTTTATASSGEAPAATSETTNEATPAPTAEATPTATAAETRPAPPAVGEPTPGMPAAPRPQAPTTPRPKRPTYEPLGI